VAQQLVKVYPQLKLGAGGGWKIWQKTIKIRLNNVRIAKLDEKEAFKVCFNRF